MPTYEVYGLGDKMTIVIDIGNAYTKLGFGGEFAPRAIVNSEVRCKETGNMRNIFSYSDSQDLSDLLVDFIHVIYFKHILLSPKDRPVVIVESLLCPTLFRETLAKVLFVHYEISTLLIVPSHLVSIATLATETALVVDVGYCEAVVIPVCHGLPILHAWQALPLGSHTIHKNIRNLLSEISDNSGIENLPESVLEDIKVRCCFVTKQSRAQQFSQPKSDIVPCPSVQYPVEGSQMIVVSGKVRETAFDVLYEEDNDHLSLATIILDSILRVNADLRVKLAESILLIGGTCMAMGFKARLKEELLKQLNSGRYDKLKLSKFKFHTAPCKENYTAWLGGAIYGSTELVSMRGLTKENYLKENRLPDWPDMRDNSHTL